MTDPAVPGPDRNDPAAGDQATASPRGLTPVSPRLRGPYALLRPLLFRAAGGDAERVHEQTLEAVARIGEVAPALALLRRWYAEDSNPVQVGPLTFPRVVGLAAGLDKNGLGVKTWSALGFGHVELGTVTARAQPGNDRPRLFRLVQSQAVINRMGFNNAGAEALARRLEAAGIRRGNNAAGVPIGVSIGKTKSTPLAEATGDYLTSFRLLRDYADYIAVNVSSPNTPGLRRLQDSDALRDLVTALVQTSRAGGAPVPILVKIAPDLTDEALDEVLAVCSDARVDGLIATNTTLQRDQLHSADAAVAAEAGGLSGAPLTVRARQVVSYVTQHTDLPVIGVGGIMTPADGQAMLDAGARALQVYSGFIYAGPALVRTLNRRAVPRRQDSV